MDLLLKALFGAIIVVIIQLFARSKNVYIAGLVPLVPTFTLISNYIVGTERSSGELRQTILFGMLAVIPYSSYLIVLYLALVKLKLVPALLIATVSWFVCAALLILVWNRR